MKNSLYAAVILSLGMMAARPVWAADSCGGIDTLTTTATDETDLGNGLKKRTWTADSVVTSNIGNLPVLYGECSAVVLMTPDGKTQMTGFCTRHDKDGDAASIAISQAPGEEKGSWKTTGGTGKFANAPPETGWAESIFREGPVFVAKWGGNCP